jgi:hypothetical protein
MERHATSAGLMRINDTIESTFRQTNYILITFYHVLYTLTNVVHNCPVPCLLNNYTFLSNHSRCCLILCNNSLQMHLPIAVHSVVSHLRDSKQLRSVLFEVYPWKQLTSARAPMSVLLLVK